MPVDNTVVDMGTHYPAWIIFHVSGTPVMARFVSLEISQPAGISHVPEFNQMMTAKGTDRVQPAIRIAN